MTSMRPAVELSTITLSDVVAVARHGVQVTVAPQAWDRVAEGRAIVARLAAGAAPVYGISTGFGALATVAIPPARRTALQHGLIRSHAAGSGDPVPREVVRAMMLLRARTLATGHTGVRPQVLAALLVMINESVTPIVPEFGSLGCSGDLAPLAHVALALTGEGTVELADGRCIPAADALEQVGLHPLELVEKEGLALINGTDGMLGMLALALADLDALLQVSDVSAAMSVEALLGTDEVFAADLVGLRPHPGQARAAANLITLLSGSPLLAAHHSQRAHIVQDAYSLRCAPAVAGAARDAVDYARVVAERELAAVIDNPVVLFDGRVVSNGNFHGAPVALALDTLAIAIAQVASISERRVDRMMDRSRSHGLPPFLSDEVGVDSGYMIAHYTAAGIVSTLKRLAVPASVDSIPTSAMQEDHVCMGWAAGLKLREAVAGLAQVLAVEVMAAGRALDLRGPDLPATGTGAARAALRTVVAGPGPDRVVADQIAQTLELVRSGELLASVARAVGELA
jgi:histidine ammonia-lyase